MASTDGGSALHRRVALVAEAAAIATGALSMTTVTPSDPGRPAKCGTLLGGGFTSLYYACEQTRGVYRAAVGLGIALGVALILAALFRATWALWVALVAAASLTAAAALLAGAVMFGDHLTARWVAIFPIGIAVSGGVGLGMVAPRLRGTGAREAHLDPSLR